MRTAQTRVGAHPGAASIAREFVVRHLTEWNATHCRDAAALAVSELVTNAVRHGRVPVTVRLSCDGRCVRVEVHDTGGQLPHLRAPSGEHGGLGLHLIEAVSTNWGVVKSGAGKVIWCELTTGLLSGE